MVVLALEESSGSVTCLSSLVTIGQKAAAHSDPKFLNPLFELGCRDDGMMTCMLVYLYAFTSTAKKRDHILFSGKIIANKVLFIMEKKENNFFL